MQLNDCIAKALGDGQINDLLAIYFGMTAEESLDDAEYRWLAAQGVAPAQINDMWYEFLSGKGYAGALNDMLYQFWCVDGGGAGGIFTELSDWEPIPGSPAGVLSKPGDRIRVSADGGVLDGIKTTGTYHFDPTKWYRVTVQMEIDVAGDGQDHDGGQFSIEMAGHDFDHVDATLGWGIAGGVLPVSPPIQTITIQPHTAETQAHFRVLGMGVAGDPIEIVSIKVEEFDSDPDAVSPTVVSSDIPADHPDAIVVTWDKPMAAKGHIVDEIDVIIGTAAPINPTHVVFHGNDMTLSFTDAFVSGAKVTWAYDDSNPHVQLHDADGNEAENQTYVVTNHIADPAPVVQSSEIADLQSDGILVTWDRDMVAHGNVKNDIAVVINGAAAVNPDSIEAHPHDHTLLGIVMPGDFAAGDVVTWAYDPAGHSSLEDGNGVEVGAGSHDVTNSLTATP